MDISNLKEKAPEIKQGLELENMYEIGYRQLDCYKPLERLPEYPMDINSTKNQSLMKTLISQVVEELMEGYESTSNINDILENKGWNTNLYTDVEKIQIINNLQNANEEQADAIGFFLSALIYANILPEDIYSWANKELTKGQKAVENLEDVMAFGIHMILEIDAISSIFKNFKLISETIEDKTSEYIKGFKEMSPNLHTDEKNILFQIVYVLNLARNTLKNRTWKQSPVITKELEFQDRLVEAFYYYMGFLSIMGFTPTSIYELYFKKERLNEWRITSQY